MENGECLATKSIMEKEAKVGYMFREAAKFNSDISDWNVSSGTVFVSDLDY